MNMLRELKEWFESIYILSHLESDGSIKYNVSIDSNKLIIKDEFNEPFIDIKIANEIIESNFNLGFNNGIVKRSSISWIKFNFNDIEELKGFIVNMVTYQSEED